MSYFLYKASFFMSKNKKTRKKFGFIHLENNLLIGRDLLITMDGPGGDIDISAIDAVIRGIDLL